MIYTINNQIMQKQNKNQKNKIPCSSYFSEKGCDQETCVYRHEKINKLCNYYLANENEEQNKNVEETETKMCPNEQYCPYQHEKKNKQCKYYFSHKGCKHHDNCVYQHKRLGECMFYKTYGKCKYRNLCKFNHNKKYCQNVLKFGNCASETCNKNLNIDHNVPQEAKEIYERNKQKQ